MKEHAVSGMRRQVLKGLAAAGLVPSSAFAEQNDSLKERAAKRGITFGSEITAKELRTSSQTAAAILADCAIIVPGIEMKWGVTEQRRGFPLYRDADFLASFAAKNYIQLRGHTAVWYRNIPNWAIEPLATPAGRDLLLKRVHDVVSHFKGRVVEWDVVNEALEPNDNLPGELRNWPPFAHGDPGYIADCFNAAHDADPKALLFYNDYGFEYTSSDESRRRTAAIHLLSELKKRNVPIHGLGIQCHLKVGNNFHAGIFRRFLSEIAALGLRISLTEFDIDDQRLPADIAARDQQVADHARLFLDTALNEVAVKKLLTWGISDDGTWLNSDRPRADGLKHRALPLDENFTRKPLWYAIASSLESAPARD